MAQSFDTVGKEKIQQSQLCCLVYTFRSFDKKFMPGWFARTPAILRKVGCILLQLPDLDPIKPTQIIIPEDCFNLSSIPSEHTVQALVTSMKTLYGGEKLQP